MILPVVKYGHPVLRQKGVPVEKVTPAVRRLIEDMLETMYAAAGVGLAAQQVGQALQITVIDVREARDRPSTVELDGKPADVAALMPLILVNPVVTPVGDPVSGPEGCLSFPEIYADIARPDLADVVATGARGERVAFRAGGLLARVVQHETDHLHGILFIDRMAAGTRKEIKSELDRLQAATKAALRKQSGNE